MGPVSGQKLSVREEISSNIFCFTTMEKSLAFTLEFCLTLRPGELNQIKWPGIANWNRVKGSKSDLNQMCNIRKK